ncbi:MAG: hypothetical protein LBL34_00725 [Clostridiales bacterium]|nr:hypothetical protein [Clostridiales bacterium]
MADRNESGRPEANEERALIEAMGANQAAMQHANDGGTGYGSWTAVIISKIFDLLIGKNNMPWDAMPATKEGREKALKDMQPFNNKAGSKYRTLMGGGSAVLALAMWGVGVANAGLLLPAAIGVFAVGMGLKPLLEKCGWGSAGRGMWRVRQFNKEFDRQLEKLYARDPQCKEMQAELDKLMKLLREKNMARASNEEWDAIAKRIDELAEAMDRRRDEIFEANQELLHTKTLEELKNKGWGRRVMGWFKDLKRTLSRASDGFAEGRGEGEPEQEQAQGQIEGGNNMDEMTKEEAIGILNSFIDKKIGAGEALDWLPADLSEAMELMALETKKRMAEIINGNKEKYNFEYKLKEEEAFEPVFKYVKSVFEDSKAPNNVYDCITSLIEDMQNEGYNKYIVPFVTEKLEDKKEVIRKAQEIHDKIERERQVVADKAREAEAKRLADEKARVEQEARDKAAEEKRKFLEKQAEAQDEMRRNAEVIKPESAPKGGPVTGTGPLPIRGLVPDFLEPEPNVVLDNPYEAMVNLMRATHDNIPYDPYAKLTAETKASAEVRKSLKKMTELVEQQAAQFKLLVEADLKEETDIAKENDRYSLEQETHGYDRRIKDIHALVGAEKISKDNKIKNIEANRDREIARKQNEVDEEITTYITESGKAFDAEAATINNVADLRQKEIAQSDIDDDDKMAQIEKIKTKAEADIANVGKEFDAKITDMKKTAGTRLANFNSAREAEARTEIAAAEEDFRKFTLDKEKPLPQLNEDRRKLENIHTKRINKINDDTVDVERKILAEIDKIAESLAPINEKYVIALSMQQGYVEGMESIRESALNNLEAIKRNSLLGQKPPSGGGAPTL